MIKKWHLPGQKLAVGKLEYKKAIEARLKIPCLFNDEVLEVMWGLKNLMRSLIPEETSELTEEDRLQMSYGMKTVLDRYGFHDFKPEMVNERIIETAGILHDCDLCLKKHSNFFRSHEHLLWKCLKSTLRVGVHGNLQQLSGLYAAPMLQQLNMKRCLQWRY